MAPPPPQAVNAMVAMMKLGFSVCDVKSKLKELLKMFNNDWTPIEENSYELLVERLVNKVADDTNQYGTVRGEPQHEPKRKRLRRLVTSPGGTSHQGKSAEANISPHSDVAGNEVKRADAVRKHFRKSKSAKVSHPSLAALDNRGKGLATESPSVLPDSMGLGGPNFQHALGISFPQGATIEDYPTSINAIYSCILPEDLRRLHAKGARKARAEAAHASVRAAVYSAFANQMEDDTLAQSTNKVIELEHELKRANIAREALKSQVNTMREIIQKMEAEKSQIEASAIENFKKSKEGEQFGGKYGADAVRYFFGKVVQLLEVEGIDRSVISSLDPDNLCSEDEDEDEDGPSD